MSMVATLTQLRQARCDLLNYVSTKTDELKVVFRADKKSWKVCLCVLAVTVVRSGLTYSFGMFVVQLESVYHSSMATQSE